MSPLIGALLGLVFATGVITALVGLRPQPVPVSPVTGSAVRRSASGSRTAADTEELVAARAGLDAVQLRLIGAAVTAGVVLVAVTGWLALGIIVGGAVWVVPHTIRTRADVAKDRERLRALAGWIEVIRDLFGAGSGIEDALVTSQRHVSPPISADVSELIIGTKLHGSRRALVRFGERFANPIADQVVWALLIATERSSASVSDVLSQAAGRAREQVAMQERLDAKRASRYMVVNAMVIMTVLLGAALVAINPAYRTYYASDVGQVVLSVIVAAQGGGFVWLLRMSRHTAGHRIPVTDSVAGNW